MTDAELEACRRDGSLLRSFVEKQGKKLTREKNGWKAPCPFHDEATPSFHVYEDGHFHCYGCRAHGTVFDFVMKRDRVDFQHAAEIVAAEAGLSRSRPRPKPKPAAGNGHEEWFPIVPPPTDAPKADARYFADCTPFEYVGADGKLLFYQRRFEKGDDKSFAQLTYGTLAKDGKTITGWHSKGPAQPFPLCRLDRLTQADPGTRVIVVEGEKAVAAAERLFPDAIVTTWLNGAGSVALTDWEPLRRFKTVIWWQDADQPRANGQKHGCFLATPAFLKLFPDARQINTNGLEAIKDGYDAADLEHDGCDDPDEWLKARLSPIRPLPGDNLQPQPWVWCDPTTMQPRLWLLGTTAMCGYATVIGGVGGVGKSSRAIASAFAVITGRRDLTDEQVFQTGKAWLITLEDNRLELERRIAAFMLCHNISREEVEGKLFVNDMSHEPLVLIETDPETSNPIITADAKRIGDYIRQNDILMTVIDPLIKAHRGIENSNEHMDALGKTANDIADEAQTSVVLAAHFRKGNDGGSRDAFRGGSALIDGLRLTRTLTAMTEADAKAFNVPAEDASRIVREQDPKANMAPREVAKWFELVSVPLGNTEVDPRYKRGDHVQALKPWKPPALFEGVSLDVMARIFDRLRAEPEPGWYYSLGPRTKYWAGTVIAEEAGKNRKQATELLGIWKTNGVLAEEDYTDPNRRETSRVVLDEALIAEILAPLRSSPGAEP